jgi:hypothetical protein
MPAMEQFVRAVVAAELKRLGIGSTTPTRAELRRAAGFFSQQDCEVAAQIPRGTVSAYESGHIKRPGCRNKATLERLCALLNVTMDEYCQAMSES